MRKRKRCETQDTPHFIGSEITDNDIVTLQRSIALLTLYEHLATHKDNFPWLPRNTAVNYRSTDGDFKKLLIVSTFLQSRHEFTPDTSTIHSFILSLTEATQRMLLNFAHSPKDKKIRAFFKYV